MVKFKCNECGQVFKGKDEYEAEQKFNAHGCMKAAMKLTQKELLAKINNK